MHVDEAKKFDKRNIARNIKDGIVTQKEYELHLGKLPDSSEKVYNPDEPSEESGGVESEMDEEGAGKKRSGKKKPKGKGN